MKYCRVVSTLFILVLTISVVWGKHKGRRSKDHLRHKHMRLLTHAKFFRHPDNYSTLTHSNHRHERGKLIGDAIDFHFLFASSEMRPHMHMTQIFAYAREKSESLARPLG